MTAWATKITGALRIVVVEDDDFSQDRIVRSLQTSFSMAHIERISTEWEFIRRFDDISRSSPTLIVLDMRLRWKNPDDVNAPDPPGSPREAGMRLLERRTNHPTLRTVPVIVKSSASLSDDSRSGIERRFNDVYFPHRDDDAESITLVVSSLLAAMPENDTPPGTRRVPNRVFISYARDDREWADRIRQVLSPYCAAGKLQMWDDSDLTHGIWNAQIEAEMKIAGIALFLVTTAFCTSEFIQNYELPELIGASHRQEGVTILWVAVSHSAVETTALGKYQCLNDPRRPLDMLKKADRTKALTEIARAIARSA